MNRSRLPAVVALWVTVALGLACASSDPMPPRRDPNHVPEEVAKHPGFNFQKAQPIGSATGPRKESSTQSPLCGRKCPEGQKCEVVQGVERCVAE